ncbi:BnaUnng04640D, partial [Brassica napus]
IRALLKENGEDKQTFSSSYDPADGGWSTYVTDANAFFAGRRIKPKAWRVHYDRGLCARLALYCYNLQNGTAYDFQVIIQIHEQNRLSFTKSFITFDAVNPSDPTSPLTFETCVKHIDDQVTHVPNLWWETHICRVEGSDEADYEWNDGAVNDYYKGEMPKWLSDENQQLCYVVKQSVGKNYPISMR